MENKFERTIQVIGTAAFERLQAANVILFGVGGVGGWCAEALIRSGVQHLTMVDFDTVNVTNLNRQLVATSANIDELKVEELRKRLLLINPEAQITTLPIRYSAETAEQFDFNYFDYVIDAIDSIADKALLLTRAAASSAKVFSSMGAGRKIDTSSVRVSSFNKVEGCPLARALRHKLKESSNSQILKSSNLLCVWSSELSSDRGTIAPVVGVFGMMLADLVIRDVLS
jgi:tRNA A37 threonylcarbamoyladenosine dehydratase